MARLDVFAGDGTLLATRALESTITRADPCPEPTVVAVPSVAQPASYFKVHILKDGQYAQVDSIGICGEPADPPLLTV